MSESISHKTVVNRLATLYVKVEGIMIEVEIAETRGRVPTAQRSSWPGKCRGDKPEGGRAGTRPLWRLDHWCNGQSRDHRQAIHAVGCGVPRIRGFTDL